MNSIKSKVHKVARRLVFPVILAILLPIAPAFADQFDVKLWPDGVVWFRFKQDIRNDPAICSKRQLDGELCYLHKLQVLQMMAVWQAALRITDPLGHNVNYVQFKMCTLLDCPTSHVVVRYNDKDAAGNLTEINNMCTYRVNGVENVGRNPNGPTYLHFKNNENSGDPGKVQPDTVVLHELGHCFGLWHEQNRADADRWLDRFLTPLYCATTNAQCDGGLVDVQTRGRNLLPLLGNYDYDSIMHYGSYMANGERRWTDHFRYAFLGSGYAMPGIAPARPLMVSARDISRVLQYQAHEYYARSGRTMGFFQSLNVAPLDPDLRPNPYLNQAQRVSAVGTPAISYQSPGNFDVFAFGSDQHIYWKSYRRELVVIGYVNGKPVIDERDTESDWQSIGCCFASDPSAVSRGPARIDVVAVNDRGEVQRIKYIDGIWARPLTLRGGSPVDGIKSLSVGRWVGPAIASRAANLLDVFVVRDDGRLAVTTWRNGIWEPWQTLGGPKEYDVSARPAAVALSADEVKLAINEEDGDLYEPMVTFGAGAPAWARGSHKGIIEYGAPPALTTLQGGASNNRYRVVVTNDHGRISIRDAAGAWRDIGGIPKPGTGPAAVASGDVTFVAVMNGEDGTSCTAPFCHPDVPIPGRLIQPGGLWIRHFD